MSAFFVILLSFALKNVSVATVIKKSVIDVRRSCLANTSSDLYLPSEEIDSFVIFISSKSIKPFCNFNIYSSTSDVRLIFVMEFLGEAPCKEHQFLVYNDDNTKTDVCPNNISQELYKNHILVKRLSLFVNIQEIDESSLVKVVITAATVPSYNFGGCHKLGKINCSIDSTSVCIDKTLQCDGDFNCGVKFEFDEDRTICGVNQESMWLVMLFTLIFVTYSLFIFCRCLKKFIIPIPEDFFIVDEKDEMVSKPEKKPLQVKISRSHSKDHLRISLSDPEPGQSEDPVEEEKPIPSSREDCVPSSSLTDDWDISAESVDNKHVKFRKVRKKRWPVFTKAEVPSYEKRLSERMKKKMLTTSTSEDEKPKITFYATTTKLP